MSPVREAPATVATAAARPQPPPWLYHRCPRDTGGSGHRATLRATRRHHRGRRRDLPVAVPAAELRGLDARDVRRHGVATRPVQRPARRALRRHLPAERVAGGPGVAPPPDVALAAVRRSARRLVRKHPVLHPTAIDLRRLGDRHRPHLLVGPHQGGRGPRQGQRARPLLRHPRRRPRTGGGAAGNGRRRVVRVLARGAGRADRCRAAQGDLAVRWEHARPGAHRPVRGRRQSDRQRWPPLPRGDRAGLPDGFRQARDLAGRRLHPDRLPVVLRHLRLFRLPPAETSG